MAQKNLFRLRDYKLCNVFSGLWRNKAESRFFFPFLSVLNIKVKEIFKDREGKRNIKQSLIEAACICKTK